MSRGKTHIDISELSFILNANLNLKLIMLGRNSMLKNSKAIFKNTKSHLQISDLRQWVHLGCSDQEKHLPQLVAFDVDIAFQGSPKAIHTDEIKDGFCYAEAAELIKKCIKSKPYNLIEYLAADVYEVIREALDKQEYKAAEISVTVHKLSPPVPDIHGAVSFTISG